MRGPNTSIVCLIVIGIEPKLHTQYRKNIYKFHTRLYSTLTLGGGGGTDKTLFYIHIAMIHNSRTHDPIAHLH